MKTILFTLEYPPFRGGVANYYANLAKSWPEKGELSVLANDKNQLLSGRIVKWSAAISALSKAIQESQAKQVIVGQLLPLGTAAFILQKFKKFEYSLVLHGMDLAFARRTIRKKLLTRLILGSSAKIICANSYVAKQVREFLPAKFAAKIGVVNPGADFAANSESAVAGLKAKQGIADQFVLLTIGRLVKRKGVDKVLAALPGVVAKFPNLVYVIVGQGEELAPISRLIRNLDLSENVKIITDASDEEKNAWYQLADVFIMPSRDIAGDYEGFGIVYLEANLAGRPVIAGDSGGVRDAVQDGFNGLLVNPESTKEITSAIITLAEDKELRERLGKQGRERALTEFNWPAQVDKFYNFLTSKF